MKTKIVYSVVSTENDSYLEQTLLSAYSARHFNQGARIELVVDEITAATLIGKREEIKKYISKLIVIEITGDYNQKQRSRYLKTNLRNYIKEDFLFVDNDTIICCSLDEIDNCEWEIAATREKNKFDTFTNKDEYMWKLAGQVGIQEDLIEHPYFNSGVMYVKNTENAHRLYDTWHSLWKKYQKRGLDTDQTSLSMANKLCNHSIHHIEDSWNCQIKVGGISFSRNARIIHYFFGMNECSYIFSLHSMHESIKQFGSIPPFVIKLLQAPKEAFFTSGFEIEYCNHSKCISQVYIEHPFLYRMLHLAARLILKLYWFFKIKNKE